VTVRRGGRTLVKGHIEFCGVAVIDRLENVVQRDPATQRGFPNVALDLAVLSLAESGDTLDLRWIDDRRNPQLTAEQALEHAPASWKRWVAGGAPSLPRVRRRVQASRIRTREHQQPEPTTSDVALLQKIYSFFDTRKHAFEMLASQIAADAIGGQGGTYHEGWLTRAGVMAVWTSSVASMSALRESALRSSSWGRRSAFALTRRSVLTRSLAS
jgi:hypothetical protein